VADRFRRDRSLAPLPPARLRVRVAGTTSREAFLTVGRRCAADFIGAFERVRRTNDADQRWLDFGCGCGRVTRHLSDRLPDREIWGVDVDAEAVRFASKNLAGTFRPIAPSPPTTLPDEFFDVVLASSVFTHLPEAAGGQWLGELARVLRPGGLLLATTHGPALTFSRPDLTRQQLAKLEAEGFLFAPGGASFNEDSAFHSLDYLRGPWTARFTLELFLERGLAGYQDLSVWRRR
jgi:SAM-dependent methyltransferase